MEYLIELNYDEVATVFGPFEFLQNAHDFCNDALATPGVLGYRILKNAQIVECVEEVGER